MAATGKESLKGGRVKGGVFKTRLTWLKETGSPEKLERVMSLLGPESRKTLSGMILATTWMPYTMLIELDKAIVEVYGDGNHKVLADLGRYSAEVNLSTTYRAFGEQTHHEFFKKSALLHSQFQDFGTATYEKTGEMSGKMIHSNYESYSPVFCSSALGYYEGCITSHGGTSPVVRETSCHCRGDSTCTYEMSWSG